MAARAYWKGHIRLSLVSFPVRLHAATTESEKISLHQYDKDSGERIRYQKVNEDGEEVPDEDIVKGYEYEKGSYVPIEDEDLEKLRVESKHTLELVQFSDVDDIDPIYFEKAYYVAPDGDLAEEAFLTVRDALKQAKKAAIGQIVLGNKERIVCLRPCCNGMILNTLRYAYEVRENEHYFEDIPKKGQINKEQLELAELLIEKKSKPFDPQKFKDHYQEGLLEIIEAKAKGNKLPKAPGRAKGQNVINIVDALKKSLEQSGGDNSSKKKKPVKKTAKKTPKKASKKKAA